MAAMKLPIERLTDTPEEHAFALTPKWWREAVGGAGDEALCEDLGVELRAHRMGPDVYLEGSVRGGLELTCSRCLGRYRQPVREPFRLVLEPAGDRVPADPEGAAALARDGLALGDELESGWFRGGEILLEGFLREVIALLLPVQPVCREECRGLCPRCGVDRNVESCDCAATSPGSPFEALRALRDELTGGEDR